VVWLQEFDTVFQLFKGGRERGDLGLHASEALGHRNTGSRRVTRLVGRGVMRGHQARWISEEMGVAGLAGAGLTWQHGGERASFVAGCIGEGTSCEALESGLDGGKVVEGVEAVGAAAKFAGGLRAAEHEQTEDGGLVAAEVENRAYTVLVLGNAGVANGSDECEVFKGVKSLANFLFRQIEYGIAAGALVACVDQGVEGERIIFGRGDLFFDEGTENAELDRIEAHIYKGAIAAGSASTEDNE
jgi:hypothetical protein